MRREYLMGNEAMALGALAAGVGVVCGYPGTPSSEVISTVCRRAPEGVYAEWSVNEKAALETAAGAAYCGARTLVTMKQVGLNVASDPLMSLAYIGVKGAMVVLVADDPGPISSQTEQDTRTFGMYSKLPVFDPSGVAEAYEMIQDAFELSEKYGTPVIFRPTTRIDHGYEAVTVKEPEEYKKITPAGFVRDPANLVIFPALSRRNHALIEKRNEELKTGFSAYGKNEITEYGRGAKVGIATHGGSLGYVRENIADGDALRLFKVATPFPFPEKLALEFLDGLDEVLCVEELDPVIERALTFTAGKYALPVKIRGKLTGDVAPSGENGPDSVAAVMDSFLKRKTTTGSKDVPAPPALPVRPPVLCAGCPHRASFYAVKLAMKGRKALFAGDIGCYTLGNAAPLDMCDTCLCMGAGLGIAQGVKRVDPDTCCFAFVGDSTFFASGISGVINAFYNQADMTLVILDNSTTAMTGHQPHPGTGVTAAGQRVTPVSAEKVLKAIGLETVVTLDPLDLKRAAEEVRRVALLPGVKAIIFRSPCVAMEKSDKRAAVDPGRCVGCRKCINELGCPALGMKDGKAVIDATQCTGCTLCAQVCPVGAIKGGDSNG